MVVRRIAQHCEAIMKILRIELGIYKILPWANRFWKVGVRCGFAAPAKISALVRGRLRRAAPAPMYSMCLPNTEIKDLHILKARLTLR